MSKNKSKRGISPPDWGAPTVDQGRAVFGIDPTSYDQWKKLSSQDDSIKEMQKRMKESMDQAIQDSLLYGTGLWHIDDNLGIAPQQQAKECQHIPINVGFHFTKTVCKKCDKELKE